jgi:hypothetical protein
MRLVNNAVQCGKEMRWIGCSGAVVQCGNGSSAVWQLLGRCVGSELHEHTSTIHSHGASNGKKYPTDGLFHSLPHSLMPQLYYIAKTYQVKQTFRWYNSVVHSNPYYSYYSNNPLVTTQFTLKHIENFHKKAWFSLRFTFLERFERFRLQRKTGYQGAD